MTYSEALTVLRVCKNHMKIVGGRCVFGMIKRDNSGLYTYACMIDGPIATFHDGIIPSSGQFYITGFSYIVGDSDIKIRVRSDADEWASNAVSGYIDVKYVNQSDIITLVEDWMTFANLSLVELLLESF